MLSHDIILFGKEFASCGEARFANAGQMLAVQAHHQLLVNIAGFVCVDFASIWAVGTYLFSCCTEHSASQ
jgi:hypothetical protein